MALTLWKKNRMSPFRNREIDRVFESFFSTPFFETQPSTLVPPMQVNEDDNEVRVKMEIAGIDEKDVEITLADGVLVVKGEKKEEKEEKDELCYCSEVSYGTFERSVSIPANVDTENIKAKFEKGVLNISLPKLEEAKARKIEIQGE